MMEGQISIFDVLADQDPDRWQPRPGDMAWFYSAGRLNHGTYTGEAELMTGYVIVTDDLRQRWFIARDRIYTSPAAAKERRRYS